MYNLMLRHLGLQSHDKTFFYPKHQSLSSKMTRIKKNYKFLAIKLKKLLGAYVSETTFPNFGRLILCHLFR